MQKYRFPKMRYYAGFSQIGSHIVATRDSHGTRMVTNVQLTLVIYLQLTYKNVLNSVHNCESHAHKLSS